MVCSPNEDFGRRNKRSIVSIRCTFQWGEYSIWAKKPCKLHRNDTTDLLFRLPKSSFGEHKWESTCAMGDSRSTTLTNDAFYSNNSHGLQIVRFARPFTRPGTCPFSRPGTCPFTRPGKHLVTRPGETQFQTAWYLVRIQHDAMFSTETSS